MARPRQKITKQRLHMTLDPSLVEEASAYAYAAGYTLSSLVELLLRQELEFRRVDQFATGEIPQLSDAQAGKFPTSFPEKPYVEIVPIDPPGKKKAAE